MINDEVLIHTLVSKFSVSVADFDDKDGHTVLEGGKTKKKLTGAGIGAKF